MGRGTEVGFSTQFPTEADYICSIAVEQAHPAVVHKESPKYFHTGKYSRHTNKQSETILLCKCGTIINVNAAPSGRCLLQTVPVVPKVSVELFTGKTKLLVPAVLSYKL